MFYGITTKATDFDKKVRSTKKSFLLKLLLSFIPRANPDAERFFPHVKGWALEISDDGWPLREIGLDKNGNPLFTMPNEKNVGFWTDMAYQQFQPKDLRIMSADEFERLWTFCI